MRSWKISWGMWWDALYLKLIFVRICLPSSFYVLWKKIIHHHPKKIFPWKKPKGKSKSHHIPQLIFHLLTKIHFFPTIFHLVIERSLIAAQLKLNQNNLLDPCHYLTPLKHLFMILDILFLFYRNSYAMFESQKG